MLQVKQTSLGLGNSTKRTRVREFSADIQRGVAWPALVELVASFAPEGRRGRPPLAVDTMRRIHVMQQWFTVSEQAMEEALYGTPVLRKFAGLGNWGSSLSDEPTTPRVRHLLGEHKLAPTTPQAANELLHGQGSLLRAGTVLDDTLIAALSSTKNASGERDPEMRQSKKGNLWHCGMQAHIGVDAVAGQVHAVRGSSGNGNDVAEGNALLHARATEVFADAGYQGAHKRAAVDKTKPVNQFIDGLERLKACICAKVEQAFRVIKRQFGRVKARHRGLKKNTAQLSTLFALSNLWMVRKTLEVLDGKIRAQPTKAA